MSKSPKELVTPGGLRLTWRPIDGWFVGEVGALLFKMAPRAMTAGQFYAQFGNSHRTGTESECLAWFDAQRLELRAALLPADARERVARALHEARVGNLSGWTGSPDDHHLSFRLADAVLAALGGRP